MGNYNDKIEIQFEDAYAFEPLSAQEIDKLFDLNVLESDSDFLIDAVQANIRSLETARLNLASADNIHMIQSILNTYHNQLSLLLNEKIIRSEVIDIMDNFIADHAEKMQTDNDKDLIKKAYFALFLSRLLEEEEQDKYFIAFKKLRDEFLFKNVDQILKDDLF